MIEVKKKKIQKSAWARCVDGNGIYSQGSIPALNQQRVALFKHEGNSRFSVKKKKSASFETSIRLTKKSV